MKIWIAGKLIVLAILLATQGWVPAVTANAAVGFTVEHSIDVARATIGVVGPEFDDDGETAAESGPLPTYYPSAVRSPAILLPAPQIGESAILPPVRAPPAA